MSTDSRTVRIKLNPQHHVLGYHILNDQKTRWSHLHAAVVDEYRKLSASGHVASRKCNSVLHDAVVKIQRRIQALKVLQKRRNNFQPHLVEDVKYLQQLAKKACK